jgi:hypothetical protein
MRRGTLALVAILVAVWSATPASAQTMRGTNWGVTGGFGIGYGTVPEGTTRDMEPALNLGVFAVVPLNESWSFQPELKYDKRTINTGEIPHEIDYLSVPILFRNKFLGIYMVQGLAVNFVTRASIFDVDFKEATTSPDFAIIIGAGKRFDRWSLEGRWETGYRSVQKDLPGDLGGVRARSLTAVVSVYLK